MWRASPTSMGSSRKLSRTVRLFSWTQPRDIKVSTAYRNGKRPPHREQMLNIRLFPALLLRNVLTRVACITFFLICCQYASITGSDRTLAKPRVCLVSDTKRPTERMESPRLLDRVQRGSCFARCFVCEQHWNDTRVLHYLLR